MISILLQVASFPNKLHILAIVLGTDTLQTFLFFVKRAHLFFNHCEALGMFGVFPPKKWSNVFRGLLISVLIIRGRLGILGFSAGGHLATVAATSFEKRPAFQILIYATTAVDAGMDLKQKNPQDFETAAMLEIPPEI